MSLFAATVILASLGAQPGAADKAARFATQTYEDPNPSDPIFAKLWPLDMTSLRANRAKLGLTGPIRVGRTNATLSFDDAKAIVSVVQQPTACEGVGEPHDLVPRTQQCDARIAILRNGTYSTANIGRICVIYNPDGTSADLATVAYDSSANTFRFNATLNNKQVAECGRSIPLATDDSGVVK